MLSSKLRAAFWTLLPAAILGLEDLPFITSPGTNVYYGDLYLCAEKSSDWTLATGGTPPSSGNGFMYGFKSTPTAPCVPGAGPTLRMKPGGTYMVTVHNKASMDYPDATLLANMITSMNGMTWAWANRELPLHTTNIHLHGVHVSGQGDHDNILKTIPPGTSLTYKYVLPSNLAGGTHWYHPHMHGKVAHQVIGGAVGQVVIEDQGVIGRTSTGGALDAAVTTLLTNKALEVSLLAFSEAGVYMGNGNPRGASLQLIRGQWHRLRISHAKPESTSGLTILQDPSTKLALNKFSGCEAYELAYDGVYLSKVPYTANGSPVYQYSVHGAGRLDLAVRCTVARSFEIWYDGGKVATVTSVIGIGAIIAASPFTGTFQSQWAPNRPDYLADLRDSFYPAGASVGTPLDIIVNFTGLNGNLFNMEVPTATFPYGAQYIQQLNFRTTKNHPIHVHQHHMQIVQPGGCGDVHRYGEFYDTITHTGDTPCLVRLRFADFSGPTIMHCHVLDHEDYGLMGWFNIPSQAFGSFEASSEYSNNQQPQVEGWACPVDGSFAPMSFDGANIYCMSANGRDCLWQNSLAACESLAAAMPLGSASIQPLYCGADHRAIWGFPGYGDSTHWCQQALNVFRPNVMRLVPGCTAVAGYTAIPDSDVPDTYDIAYYDGNVQQLADVCSGMPSCKGFSSLGIFKSEVTPMTSPSAEQLCMYIKNAVPTPAPTACTPVAGFIATPDADSYGNDISHLQGASLASIAQVCANVANCVGFNQNGWIKKQVNNPLESSTGTCFYTKMGLGSAASTSDVTPGTATGTVEASSTNPVLLSLLALLVVPAVAVALIAVRVWRHRQTADLDRLQDKLSCSMYSDEVLDLEGPCPTVACTPSLVFSCNAAAPAAQSDPQVVCKMIV